MITIKLWFIDLLKTIGMQGEKIKWEMQQSHPPPPPPLQSFLKVMQIEITYIKNASNFYKWEETFLICFPWENLQ